MKNSVCASAACLAVMAVFGNNSYVVAQTPNKAAIVAIGQSLNSRSDAYVQYDSTNRYQWAQKTGNGVEAGHLSANFDGAGSASTGIDDIAGICFKPNDRGNGHVLVTGSPGDRAGTLWQKALGDNSQYTYYIDSGDFNGDGIDDIGAFYHGRSGDSPNTARMKITYGPNGAVQTSYASSPGASGQGIDWLFPAANDAAFLPGDFVGTDNFDDVAVVTRSGQNLVANFYSGPNGAPVPGLTWNLGSGTVAALRRCDFNADNSADIAVVLFDETTGLYSARIVNGPNGTISPTVWDLPFGNIGAVRSVLAKDFNGDGRCDLALAYSNSNGNFAFIRYDPQLGIPSATLPLQADTSRQFSYVAGDFGEPLSTQGSCPAGVALDRCGMCGGDGTSCLGCTVTDISQLITAITQEFVLLRDLNSRQLRILLTESNNDKKVRKYVTAELKKIDTRYNQFIGDIYAALPPRQLQCQNTTFCTAVNNVPVVSKYKASADGFLKGVDTAGKRMMKLTKRKSAINNFKKRLKRTKAVHATVNAKLLQIPASGSSCLP